MKKVVSPPTKRAVTVGRPVKLPEIDPLAAEPELLDEPPGSEVFAELGRAAHVPDSDEVVGQAIAADGASPPISSLPTIGDDGDEPVAPVHRAPRTALKMAAPEGLKDSPTLARGQILVTRQFKLSGERIVVDDPAEALAVQSFATIPAQVGVTYSMTINLENYESAKVGVTVTLPCYIEELDRAAKFASDFASTRMSIEVGQIKSELRGSGAPAPVTPAVATAPAKAAKAAVPSRGITLPEVD